MMTRHEDGQEEAGIPRLEGCVILLDDHAWEDHSILDAVSAPIPFAAWLDETRRAGYGVEWTPAAALSAEPYRGGTVVEIVDDHARSYVAVPPELVDRLAEIMDARDYGMVREDIASLDNPEAHGYTATRLDAPAWEQRRQVTPNAAPLPTETWVEVIRAHHLGLTVLPDARLSLDDLYPYGQVVAVDDVAGRNYFAVPRAAFWLVHSLTDESAHAGSEDAV